MLVASHVMQVQFIVSLFDHFGGQQLRQRGCLLSFI